MVADRIEVTSRRAGAPHAFVWTLLGRRRLRDRARQRGAGRARVRRGTEIVLHLKEDAKHYLEAHEIERIVKTYSDHILFPIELAGDDGEPRQINTASALWQRPKSELKPEDYTQAYRSLAGAFDEPAMTLHYRAEGRQSYAVLLFVPSSPPFDLFDPNRHRPREALCAPRLHHRRCGAAAALSALRARRGRQRGPAAQHLARDAAEQSAGRADAQGADRPRGGRARNPRRQGCRGLSPRCGTRSAASSRKASTRITSGARRCSGSPASPPRPARTRSLEQVVADFKPNQTEIYYLVGDTEERLKSNPKLEAARARGIEVLLLDRSGRRVLDRDAARLQGQAAQVAEPGRGGFRPRPAHRERRSRSRSPPPRRSTTR